MSSATANRPTGMSEIAERYERVTARFTALVRAVPASAWDNPSPCEGWSAADVVGHLVETQRDFLTKHGADLGEAPDVAADPAAAWVAHAGQVARALSDDALPAREFDGFFGPTTVGAAFEQFYVWDMVVHRWDIARAAGLATEFTDDELDRLESGADSFGPALYLAGVCRPGVEVPADADRATRVLARLGRRV